METGHCKNVANFETLIIVCTGFGEQYNPSNTSITIPVLTALHTQAKTAIKDVKTTEIPFNNVEGQRQTTFKTLKPTATKIINALKAAAAPKSVIDDAETINRKIQGRRANNTIEETPDGEEPKTKRSVSQQSFDLLVDHLEKLIELIDVEPKYNPNEEPLKITTLTTYKTELATTNTTVKTTYIPYKNALQTRNNILYEPEVGIVDTAQIVKNYVKSVFGTKSSEYKQLTKLTFRRIK